MGGDNAHGHDGALDELAQDGADEHVSKHQLGEAAFGHLGDAVGQFHTELGAVEACRHNTHTGDHDDVVVGKIGNSVLGGHTSGDDQSDHSRQGDGGQAVHTGSETDDHKDEDDQTNGKLHTFSPIFLKFLADFCVASSGSLSQTFYVLILKRFC